jgi:hypothetical protein
MKRMVNYYLEESIMFKQYTGIEYMAIDVANHYGLDKMEFEDRISWVKSNQEVLESLADKAEDKPLYMKSVNHFKKALKGLPTGHTVALDSCASGLQLMSVMTGCESGAYMTGLIDPNKRMDAYSKVTDYMNQLLDEDIEVPRKEAKYSLMTSLYASMAKPIEIFGKGTPAYKAFYEVLSTKCKGAYALLRILLNAWDSSKEYNHWVLPDGFNAYIPVMEAIIDRVKIEELNYTMSVQTWVNKPIEFGLSLPANCVHSVDAYVLRTLVRRCNYNVKQVKKAIGLIKEALLSEYVAPEHVVEEAVMPIHLYIKTGLADIVCINNIEKVVHQLPHDMLRKLLTTLETMLQHEPFEVITVHDSFAALAGNCNRLRYWYKEILAEIAESTLLNHLLTQIIGEDCTFKKINPNLASLIRNSNYGLS